MGERAAFCLGIVCVGERLRLVGSRGRFGPRSMWADCWSRRRKELFSRRREDSSAVRKAIWSAMFCNVACIEAMS